MSEKKGNKKKWRPPLKPATEKEILAQKAKNGYKKLLRKSEFKNFKSEVLGEADKSKSQIHVQRQQGQVDEQQQPSKNPPKETMFSKAERERKKTAKAKAEAKAKSRADAESRRQAIDKYEENKKNNFKHLSKKTKKGQPHMGSQMEVLLAKIQKQMQ